MNHSPSSRRHFLKTSALAGAGFWIAGRTQAQESRSANERVAFACIGIDGKGLSDTADAGRLGDVVAICDIDDKRLAKSSLLYPRAKRFNDWRKLLDEMGSSIDAVTVSTADHTHAVIAAAAMRLGKHAFVQKPLTRTLHEARFLGQLAREQKVATQMGNQGTAESALRKAAAIVQSGALGDVTEVHAWTNRPIWPQGVDRPETTQKPKSVHWDLFLGPAPQRDYAKGYHPFKWRGWWDFGCGALGDMACHIINMPFMALDLRNPISVEAVTSGHNGDSFPKKSVVTYEFAATDKRPPLKLFWYDGGNKPDASTLDGRELADNGAIVVGRKGKLLQPTYGEAITLVGVDEPKVEFTQSPGHFEEFVRAIRGEEPAVSNFPDYAAPLTETVLLGNLAIWLAREDGVPSKKIEWDSANLTATNAPEVAHMIKSEYHNGYSL